MNKSTTQLTIVLTLSHSPDEDPTKIAGAALAKIRDAVNATAKNRDTSARVVDAAVGTVVYNVTPAQDTEDPRCACTALSGGAR